MDGTQTEPLLPTIARDQIAYFADAMPIQRMLVRVRRDGSVFIRGQREEIERLITILRHDGLQVEVEYLSLCG